MESKKTKDYSIFKFRDDNREKIDLTHVKKLEDSIKTRNLLALRPIMVNENMEVIDGQHRLMAAKNLGVEIYYQVDSNLKGAEIILMNIAKSWTNSDYLNYYTKNGYPEYIKLAEFMKKHELSLKVALSITMSMSREDQFKFKSGEYKFNSDEVVGQIELCWDIVKYIKKMNGYSIYTYSSRFWKALIKLVKHNMFDKKRWFNNLQRMAHKMGPRARVEDYLRVMMEIHNWHSNSKINLLEDE